METNDVVIVGAGIGGSALAKALADDGLDVLVLEQSEVYEDRVRGESDDALGRRRSHADSASSRCCSTRAPASSETWVNYHLPDQRDEIPAGMMIPDVPGSLNLRHPEACARRSSSPPQARARRCCRGTRDARLHLGAEPTVRWRDGGREHEVQCAHRRRRRRAAVTGPQSARARARAGAGDQPRDGTAPRRSRGRRRRARLPCRRRRPVHGDFHQKRAAAPASYLFPSVSRADRYVGAGQRGEVPRRLRVRVPSVRQAARGRPAGRPARHLSRRRHLDRRAVRRRRGA